MSILQFMTNEHRECDTIFATAEQAVANSDWEMAEKAFLSFSNETLIHFKREEEELFPAFETQTGNMQGPTQVMRYEHEQVKGLIGKLAEAMEAKDKDAYLSLCESMMILLQQHNMKEEQMLYAMCERLLSPNFKEETLEKMKQVVL
ncbi:MAG: hemerythrin domain-containing protein [Sulfurovum sp.]|nr:hemerythrin domain-containing protein [Sulfurovum sp.]MCB4744904.1 hemerythrin domain-containing protein [Sulfurovum sp.]MCB4746093.1 hemerythrin domain-containing protein [Sulfurovum sp.]MCB4748244.1 hemerythrin domain-containing protein [Sulfurovum sp.]MCB4749619.1 hemerythrin domain-containing protein [Sulfurovum sp.]